MDKKKKKQEFLDEVASKIVSLENEKAKLKNVYDESIANLNADIEEQELRQEAYKKLK